MPGVLSVSFAELAAEATCARGCSSIALGLPHDPAWWAVASPINIQVNVPQLMRYFAAHAPQVEKLRRMARHEMLAQAAPADRVGWWVTLQHEPFAVAFRDAGQLASDECVMLGEYPEAWQHMNVPLLERIAAMGNLHVFTARGGNGRMYGYLMSAIGEAFHACDQLEAEQVCFYADPGWPGLGRKLQHAAIDDLRAKGVQRVMMFQPGHDAGWACCIGASARSRPASAM